MKVIETALPGVLIIEPQVMADTRGFLLESFSARRYQAQAGIRLPFVQDNVARSRHGVLRGLHFQRQRPQGKLIQVLAGTVFDVAVDIDPRSASFGQHVAVTLSAGNHRQLWVPPGLAHGFCVLSEEALVHYKCTDYHDPHDASGLAWNCPRLALSWPIAQPVLSDRDQQLPGLEQFLPA